MISENILKKFIRDYSLPISVLRPDYFAYYVELYDAILQTKEKFQLLQDTLKNYATEQDFFTAYNAVKDRVFELKETEAYQNFISCDMRHFYVQNKYCKKDIFKATNAGKFFVSVDLVKANFQALRFFNEDLVNGAKTYDEWMANFTDVPYFIASKYIRQVIFGNMNPKRQVTIERYLVEQVLQQILAEQLVEEDQIAMVSADEIVFQISSPSATKEVLKRIIEIGKAKGITLRVELFRLRQLAPYDFYVKEFFNQPGVEFKSVPRIYFPQVYKHYMGLPVEGRDLVFVHEGQLAKFLEPLSFAKEWKNEKDKRTVVDSEVRLLARTS